MIRRAWVWVLAAALAACDGADGPAALQGYVEGEEVVVAAPAAGWLEAVAVREGDMVAPGQLLFRLDTVREQAQLAAAQAELEAAEARLRDLQVGARPEEIRMIEAQLTQALAEQAFARSEATRFAKLVSTSAGDRRSWEEAQAALERSTGRVAELRASLDVARLPARAELVAAQAETVAAAVAAVRERRWRLDERSVRARVAARVEEVVRFQGEHAPEVGPVLRLLPPDARKVRFFAPQGRLAGLEPGREVGVACDGCPAGLSARVSFIADEVEFTPPIIYSTEARQKLVVMVEARLPAGVPLRPGQPVDVSLP